MYNQIGEITPQPLIEGNQEGRQAMHTVRRQLGEWLLMMGFQVVEVEYAGENFRTTTFEPRLFRNVGGQHYTVHGPGYARLIELFEYVLNVRVSDWRDGEGSWGKFRWIVTDGNLNHTHCLRGRRKLSRTKQGWF
jgi:hypothetical protein